MYAYLKANVGVSFTTADSSFSAPFTSSSDSISCLQQILCEGRSTMCNYTEVIRYYVTISTMKYTAACINQLQLADMNSN
jgi:cation-transporting ATPase 13A3/4/5